MIQNGDRVRDVVTGFEGVVIAVCEYWTQIPQVLVSPDYMGLEGEMKQPCWFDVPRIEKTGGRILLPGSEEIERPKADKQKTGFLAQKRSDD